MISAFVILCFLLTSPHIYCASQDLKNGNIALRIDGDDNNVRIGMPVIKGEWTLEAWIKGDGNAWKDKEVVIGGGEYSNMNNADRIPLIIKKGRLHNAGTRMSSPDTLSRHTAANSSSLTP